jgi:hypothetical protein
MKQSTEHLVRASNTAKTDHDESGAQGIVVEMGKLLIDAVLTAHRLAADHQGKWSPKKEYPPVPAGEIAKALVYVFADGLHEPFDVNRLREVVTLYLSHSPDQWIASALEHNDPASH